MTTVTIWDEDVLWEKAKLYVARAAREEQEGQLFPFWSILALEMLGRTVLASVHPALLADPQSGEHLLYAFGFGKSERVRSVPAATVFRRCAVVVESFTEGDVNGAIGLIELRNEELHSGGSPFAALKTGIWLPDYYRLCEILLSALDKQLDDLFTEEEARAAETMIAGAAEALESEVKQHVADIARAFKELDAVEIERRLAAAERVVGEHETRGVAAPHQMGLVAECPACSAKAWISGEFVRAGEPQAAEEDIVTEIVKIPTALECVACGLSLSGHGRMHAIGLGGLFTAQLREDPASFYHIEFEITEADIAQYFEEDYMNE
jgi:hypothetical protein